MTEKLGIANVPIQGDLRQLDKDLDKAADQIESKLLAGVKKAGAKIADIGAKVIAGGIGVATGAMVALGTAGWTAGQKLEDAYDKIVIGTGASGDVLEGLKEDFNAVFKEVSADPEKLGEVIAALNSRLKLSGEAMQNLAKPVSEVSRLMGTDGVVVVEKLTRAMGDWGVSTEDGAAMLDKFFVASQTTGAGMEGLMSQVVQFGAPLRLMGFTLEESIAMFAKWEQEGVNAELVMGSLRIAAGKFASEGVDLKEGLQETITTIATMTDESAALALGMEIFGARAGPDMVAAIREGRFELGNLVETLNTSQGAILETAKALDGPAEKLDVLKQAAMTALHPLGAKMEELADKVLAHATPALEDLAAFISETVVPAIDPLAEGIGLVIGGLDALTKGDVTAFLESLQEGMYKVGEAFGIGKDEIDPVIEGLEGIWETINVKVLPVVAEVVDFVRENLRPILIGLGAMLLAVVVPAFFTWAAAAGTAAVATATALAPVLIPIAAIGAAVALLVKAWENDWGGMQTKLTAFWEDTAKPVFETVKKWLQTELPEAIAKMTTWFSEKWTAITGAFNTAKEAITGAAGTVKKWFSETLPNAAEDMRSKITSKVKTVTDEFKSKFTSTMDELNPQWREDWEEVKAAASEKLEETKTLLGEKLDEAQAKVTTFLTDVKKAWDDKWEEIRKALAEFGTKLIAAAGEAVAPLLKYIGEQVDELKKKFTGIDWAGIGQGIIDGIKGGISNAVGGLATEAANAAKAALGAAKRFLGIESPSKVAAAEIGKPFVLGIVEGIEGAQPELMSTTADMMKDMAGVASSLASMGGYEQQAGIGAVVDAIIADARTAGKKLVDWFKLWTDETRANVEMGGEASGLLGKMFAPVKQWADGLTAMAGYQKAANMKQSADDMVNDARDAGRRLMDWFKLWKESTFENVELGGKAAELMSKLFAPVKGIIDGIGAIAGYQKAENILQNVTDMIADARLAGKALVTYFLIWTETTFENVAEATRGAVAMAGLFAPFRVLVDGIGAIAAYQRQGNLPKKVERLIADARAAGKLLVEYFKLWSETTFGNVEMATQAAEAMAGLFGAVEKISAKLQDLVSISEIQPEAMAQSAAILTQFADVFLTATRYMAMRILEVAGQVAPIMAAGAELFAAHSAQAFAWFRQGSDWLNALVDRATPDEGRVNAFVAAMQRTADALRAAAHLSFQISGSLGSIGNALALPNLTLQSLGALNIAPFPGTPRESAGLAVSANSGGSVSETWIVNAHYAERESETSLRDTVRALQMGAA